MNGKNLIVEQLSWHYEDFLKYCQEAGKTFVEELDREDFIAYRSEYAVSHKEIEQLKNALNFQDKQPVEEISPPQNIFDEPKDSLQKHFKIYDLTSHESNLISDLDFNTRVRRCLEANNYVTLADEALDEFLRSAALKRDPQIDSIIAAFETFSTSVRIKNFLKCLPEEIKSKRARPFLYACSLNNVDFFAAVPEDLPLAELPKFLAEKELAFGVADFETFVDEIRFDVGACAKKIAAALNQREFEIVRRRAEGVTLEETGRVLGITRERVRQLELKSLERFKRYGSDVRKIFYFLHALTDGKSVITLDDMKAFVDTNAAEIIYFLAAKVDLRSDIFHFDKGLNSFVFHNGTDLDENELSKNLLDIMDENIFEAEIETLAREKNVFPDLIKAKILKVYKRSGKIFHRDKLSLKFKFAYVLKARFPNGYKIADETSYSRFMRCLQEIFDEKISFTQCNVDSKIGIIGVLCARGKYIHPDFVSVPEEIIGCVKNFVDNSERTAFFYKEIFESLRDLFIGTQVTNHYFLQGVMKFYRLPYIMRKDYLTKSGEMNMGKEFDKFIAERGESSAQEIKAHFVSFKDFNIEFLLLRCPEVIRIDNAKFMHASRLKLQDDDFEPMKKFLRQNCSTPVKSSILFNLFFERFAEFMARNEIYSHRKLFGVLQYMFRDDFKFSRPYISATDIKNISNRKILLGWLEGTDEISIEDLVGICDENEIHYVSKTHLIDDLHPEFIRVDEFTLRHPESIGITDEIILAVVEGIQSAVEQNGGWLVAEKFDEYEWLPRLETPWNSFLLEETALLAQDALCKIKNPSVAINVSSAIFLSEDFAEDDYQTLLEKILLAEHNKEPFRSEEEIFSWLKAQGLCNKKLPKFLEGGKAFALLNK